jgi:hypothetical protein
MLLLSSSQSIKSLSVRRLFDCQWEKHIKKAHRTSCVGQLVGTKQFSCSETLHPPDKEKEKNEGYDSYNMISKVYDSYNIIFLKRNCKNISVLSDKTSLHSLPFVSTHFRPVVKY